MSGLALSDLQGKRESVSEPRDLSARVRTQPQTVKVLKCPDERCLISRGNAKAFRNPEISLREYGHFKTFGTLAPSNQISPENENSATLTLLPFPVDRKSTRLNSSH